MAGLEAQYNSLLAGRDGSEEVEQTATGEPIPLTGTKIKPQVAAGDLRLTLCPTSSGMRSGPARLRSS